MHPPVHPPGALVNKDPSIVLKLPLLLVILLMPVLLVIEPNLTLVDASLVAISNKGLNATLAVQLLFTFPMKKLIYSKLLAVTAQLLTFTLVHVIPTQLSNVPANLTVELLKLLDPELSYEIAVSDLYPLALLVKIRIAVFAPRK